MDPTKDDIARVAQAIWEAEGKPEGRDFDHWMRAKKLIQEGRAAELYPDAVREGGAPEARPVQPGFKDVPPGIVPGARAPGGTRRPLREAACEPSRGAPGRRRCV